MRITFINPFQGTKYPQPPIGLALLASVSESRGHTVQILDTNTKVKSSFHFAQSDLICLTAMTPTIDEAPAEEKKPDTKESLPAAAISKLKEGQNTTFNNGQVWTLKNGKPVRVK